MEFSHGKLEKLKFCFLKMGKSNYERLVLLTILTKTAGFDMPAVGSGKKENAANQTGDVMNKRRHVFELHVEQEWAHHILPGGKICQLSAGKLRCQRLPVPNGVHRTARPTNMDAFGFVWLGVSLHARRFFDCDSRLARKHSDSVSACSNHFSFLRPDRAAPESSLSSSSSS
jgi:hypothetical protein